MGQSSTQRICNGIPRDREERIQKILKNSWLNIVKFDYI